MAARVTLFLFSILILTSVEGQDEGNPLLSSPYRSIRTHLENLQPESYNDSLAALPFLSNAEDFEAARTSAIKLKQILDGKGLYIDVTTLPRAAKYYDSLEDRHIYLISSTLPEIALTLQGNDWVYSARAQFAIDQQYGEVFRYGTDQLLEVMPKAGSRKYFGLYLFQYIGILLLALLSASATP